MVLIWTRSLGSIFEDHKLPIKENVKSLVKASTAVFVCLSLLGLTSLIASTCFSLPSLPIVLGPREPLDQPSNGFDLTGLHQPATSTLNEGS